MAPGCIHQRSFLNRLVVYQIHGSESEGNRFHSHHLTPFTHNVIPNDLEQTDPALASLPLPPFLPGGFCAWLPQHDQNGVALPQAGEPETDPSSRGGGMLQPEAGETQHHKHLMLQGAVSRCAVLCAKPPLYSQCMRVWIWLLKPLFQGH